MAHNRTIYDACIIGGGPAGLAAATWLGRFRRSVVLVDSGEYRNRWIDISHGYLGSDPMDPEQFRQKARRDLSQYEHIETVDDHISSVEKKGDIFRSAGRRGEYSSRRVVLATGVVDAFPAIEGFEDHYGKGVFHCPLCDGYEARDKHVAVLGFSEHSARFANNLLNWAASVALIAQKDAGRDDEGLAQAKEDPEVQLIWERPVKFEGPPGGLEGIALESGKLVPCEVAFFSTGNFAKSKLADHLGCTFTEEDCIEVDSDGMTSVAGVYAAGDLTPGPHLIQVAAAKGAIAGSACAESLID